DDLGGEIVEREGAAAAVDPACGGEGTECEDVAAVCLVADGQRLGRSLVADVVMSDDRAEPEAGGLDRLRGAARPLGQRRAQEDRGAAGSVNLAGVVDLADGEVPALQRRVATQGHADPAHQGDGEREVGSREYADRRAPRTARPSALAARARP